MPRLLKYDVEEVCVNGETIDRLSRVKEHEYFERHQCSASLFWTACIIRSGVQIGRRVRLCNMHPKGKVWDLNWTGDLLPGRMSHRCPTKVLGVESKLTMWTSSVARNLFQSLGYPLGFLSHGTEQRKRTKTQGKLSCSLKCVESWKPKYPSRFPLSHIILPFVPSNNTSVW